MAWTAASGATSYTWTLYQQASNVSTYSGSLVSAGSGSVSAPTVSASFGGLVIGSNYYYTVYASNASGTSPVASSPIVQYIPNPYNLTLAVTSSNATLSWSSTGTSPTFYYTLTQTTAYSYTSGTTTTIANSNTTASSVTPTFTPVSGSFYYYSIYEVTSVGTSPLFLSPIVGYAVPVVLYTSTGAVVTTLAGSGSATFADGTGAGASFNQPRGVAVLSDGNYVVGDPYNYRVRLVTPAGVVTTLAGSGSSGSADGTGAAASFGFPAKIAVISSSVIAVADFGSSVRLVTYPGGVVTTIGSGFSGTSAIALDPTSGNLIAADQNNSRVSLVTYPGGSVSLIAGSSSGFADGTGTNAKFNYPYGAIVSPTGVIAVGDANNHRIRLISSAAAGVVTTLAGQTTAGSADGTGAGASFNQPDGVAILSNGNIIVADTGNSLVRMVTSGGVVTTLSGRSGELSSPRGVAVLSNGNIIVADGGSNRIKIIAFQTLAAPTSPTLSITSGTATLGWTAASGATAYNWVLYRSTTSNFNGTSNSSGSTTSNAPTSAPTGLSSGNFWYFTVASSNASGVSSAIASSIVSY
jgi:hypothetical protein